MCVGWLGTWFKVITLSDESIYDLALEILLNNIIKIQKMTIISLGNFRSSTFSVSTQIVPRFLEKLTINIFSSQILMHLLYAPNCSFLEESL